MNDWRLLREYTEHDSQPAFAQLVERHTRLVYWTCLRDVRTPQLAEDATQVVFLLLARKASRIGKGVLISGWLFKTARFVAKDIVKQESRRRVREERAAQEIAESPDAGWTELEPLLNDALMSLNAADREAVLLRYFDALSLREVAEELDASEEAARKRITRAVDKLRAYLTKRDVALSVAALTILLSDKPAQAVPMGCQAALTRTVPLIAAGHGAGIVLNSHLSQLHEGVLSTMVKTKITIIAASTMAGLVLAGAFALVAHANQPKPESAGQPAPTAAPDTNKLQTSTVNTALFADNTAEAQKLRLGSAGASGDPKVTAEQEISAILRLIVDATNRRDLTWCDKYSSPDFTLIIPNKATLSLNQIIQMSVANLAVMSPYQKSMTLQSCTLNNGEAQITGTIHEVATITAEAPTVPKGSVLISDTSFTETWTKKSGKWLAARTIMLHNSATLNGKAVPGAF